MLPPAASAFVNAFDVLTAPEELMSAPTQLPLEIVAPGAKLCPAITTNRPSTDVVRSPSVCARLSINVSAWLLPLTAVGSAIVDAESPADAVLIDERFRRGLPRDQRRAGADPDDRVERAATTQLPPPSQMVPLLSEQLVPWDALLTVHRFETHAGTWQSVGDVEQSDATVHCGSHVMTSDAVVKATPVHTCPTLPPSRPVPSRPTVRVTVHVPVVAPHENVALADVGFVMVPQDEVHSSVCVPPFPPTTCPVSVAVSGGKSSDGLIDVPEMPGHPNGGWVCSVTGALTAMIPLATSAPIAASVGGIVQVTRIARTGGRTRRDGHSGGLARARVPRGVRTVEGDDITTARMQRFRRRRTPRTGLRGPRRR